MGVEYNNIIDKMRLVKPLTPTQRDCGIESLPHLKNLNYCNISEIYLYNNIVINIYL